MTFTSSGVAKTPWASRSSNVCCSSTSFSPSSVVGRKGLTHVDFCVCHRYLHFISGNLCWKRYHIDDVHRGICCTTQRLSETRTIWSENGDFWGWFSTSVLGWWGHGVNGSDWEFSGLSRRGSSALVSSADNSPGNASVSSTYMNGDRYMHAHHTASNMQIRKTHAELQFLWSSIFPTTMSPIETTLSEVFQYTNSNKIYYLFFLTRTVSIIGFRPVSAIFNNMILINQIASIGGDL